MSVSALLRGTYEHLLDNTSIQKESLGIHEDGHPIPGFPKYYVSIHLTNWSEATPPVGTGLFENYSIACTVTKRLIAPIGKVMPLLFIEELEGIEPIAREIAKALDKDYNLLNRANGFLHNDRSCIIEPLRWSGTTIPQVVGGDWLLADPTDTKSALVVSVNFRGAGRDQEFGNVE